VKAEELWLLVQGATLRSVSVALVVPAVGVGSVMSRRRSVAGAAVPLTRG
jgi:hypothetical protein